MARGVSAVTILLICGLSAAKIDRGIFKMSKPEAEPEVGKHWALLVAGSNGYYNYRHQADICHAYQIVKKHGIPDERIVVMMYDDIAYNEENPFPGKIFNKPNGPNVYVDVPKDYTGEDVTPENFLNVLQGNEEGLRGVGTGKVIKSGPNDHIFVNFADHGAPGLIAFPADELHARQLMKVIMKMYNEKKYKQMVFYVEACESGSMFQTLLPKDINVYATTAANGKESSYACYFDKKVNSYLGDVYSVKWMEDSDKENINTETLQKQFRIVKEETNTSHVQEYGDMSIGNEVVADFQGGAGMKYRPPLKASTTPAVPLGPVRSEDVPMETLHQMLKHTYNKEERKKLQHKLNQVMKSRYDVEKRIKHIVGLATSSHQQKQRIMTERLTLTKYDCYEPMVEYFDQNCFDVSKNDYALRHLYMLVNLCEEQVAPLTIMEAMEKVCINKN